MESANIVGYQNLPTARNLYTFTAQVFLPVQGDETLGAIAVQKGGSTEVSVSNFKLTLLDPASGEPAEITDDPNYPDGVAAEFVYLVPSRAETLGKTAGWYYLADRSTNLYPQNDRVIPHGTGFLIRSTAAGGAQLVYSGAVGEDPIEKPAARNLYVFTGFALPKDGTLGDLTVAKGGSTEVSVSNFKLTLLDPASGEPAEITDDPNYPDGVSAEFVYLIPSRAETLGKTAGWYYLVDRSTNLYPQNDRVLTAGQGILIRSTAAGGAILTIPSAL